MSTDASALATAIQDAADAADVFTPTGTKEDFCAAIATPVAAAIDAGGGGGGVGFNDAEGNPAANGSAADGTSIYAARRDHVHPTDSALSAAISAEAGTRAANDTTLASAITTEASTRASADTTNASAITTEATARAAADLAIIAGNVATATALQAASADRAKLDGIAAGATANTASSATPIVASTGAAGVATPYSREDHVHPAQTTVSGLAGSATILATARKIGGVSFNGSAEVEGSNWGWGRRPDSPHVDDEEFEGAMPGRATLGTGAVGTAIDGYASFATSGQYRYSWDSMRRSWLMLQPSSAGAPWALHYALNATVGTNRTIWARMGWNSRYSSTVVNGDHSISFALAATSSGLPDTNNRVIFGIMETDTNEYALQTSITVAGVASGNVEIITTLGQERLAFDSYLMHKVGSTWYFYAATTSGAWCYLPTLKLTGALATLDRVSVDITNASSTEPGNMIMGVDFLRHSDSIIFP